MAFGKIKVWNLLKTIDEESDVPVFIGLYTRETGHAGPTSAWVDQDKQGPVKKGSGPVIYDLSKAVEVMWPGVKHAHINCGFTAVISPDATFGVKNTSNTQSSATYKVNVFQNADDIHTFSITGNSKDPSLNDVGPGDLEPAKPTH